MINVRLNGQTLPLIDVAKNLGSSSDSGVRFDKQLNNIIRNLFSSLRLIYNSAGLLNLTCKQKQNIMWMSRFISFKFYDVVYGPCLSKA